MAPRPSALCSPISTVHGHSLSGSFHESSDTGLDALSSRCTISVIAFSPSSFQTDRTRIGTLTQTGEKMPAKAQNGQAKALSLTRERSHVAADVYPVFSI